MRSDSSSRSVSGLVAGPGVGWRQSAPYAERLDAWSQEYRRLKDARRAESLTLGVVFVCAGGWYVLGGLWELFAAVAGGVHLLLFLSLFVRRAKVRQRIAALRRERHAGLLPSVPQIRAALMAMRPGSSVVRAFPDGRIARFDSEGVAVAYVESDLLEEFRIESAELREDGRFDLVLRGADGVTLTFPFGTDETDARLASDLLRSAASAKSHA